MNKKEILIILLIICCAFSLQAVSAVSDANSTDHVVLTTDSNVSAYALPSSDTDTLAEVANADSFSDLQGIINGAADGSEISLTRNYTYKDTDSGSTGISISGKTITINGNGNVIIDANQKSRIFNILGSATVTLKGITFINGNAVTTGTDNPGHGGSIWARGIVHIDNCNFINNTATRANGGAVCIAGKGSTITNSYFEGNRAIRNTANEASGIAGALFINANNTRISNTQFIKNMAGLNAGAIGTSANKIENCTIVNCNFTSNTANGSAGAVGMQSKNFHIYNSTFKYNEAKGSYSVNPTYPGNGGGMVMRGWDSSAYNCTFIGNVANLHGGAAYSTNTSYNPLNNNTGFVLCTFTDNTAGSNGGAVDWSAGATHGYIRDSTFVNNTAKRSGGAIYFNTGAVNCTIISSTFEDNIAETNGGALAWFEGAEHGVIYTSVFTNNVAKRNGGAVYWNGHNGTIQHSKFFNNRATGTNWEYTLPINMGTSIVHGENGTLILGDIIVLQDSSLPIDSSISNYLDKLVVLNYTWGNDLRFESYVVVPKGSGYTWKQLDEININVSESIISPVDWAIDQYFGGDGGTILWSGDLGYVYNCTFVDSNSARRGGGAYMTGCDYVTYESCNFTNCTSGTNGGGVDWLAGANYGKIYNCIFNGTQAARSAGAIYYDGWYGDMQNITIINTKSNGGNSSFRTSKGDLITYAGWDSSHWDTNTTGGDAGAIMFTGSNIVVHNVTFTNCIGAGRGGAVFLQDNFNVTFDECKFENNFAAGTARNTYDDDKNISSGYPNVWLTGYGGAIAFDVNAHMGIIKNSQFINNTAIRLGGAISFGRGSYDGRISNSRFDNNTAYRSGGAISWDGSDGTMIDCNFTNNAALGTDVNRVIFSLNNLGQIINGTSLPSDSTDKSKIYVYIQYDGDKKANYTMYVYDTYTSKWAAIEFTTETGPSTTDWVTDEYFGGDGGTIFWRGDNGFVDNCRFIDSNSARRGGGAYMTGSDNITFQNSYFENCTSGTNGGGLDWLAGANYGKVINCTFNNTRAARSAGAIYYDGDYGRMENLTIINTRSYGGTLEHSTYGRNDVIYAKWDASHWDTNTTGGDAGAIMFTGDHEYIYNVTFINTTSQGRGGAVFLQDNQNITFDSCKFIGCEASGIATNTWKDYTKDRDDNNPDTKLDYKLTGHGGSIAFDVGAHDATIKNSEFIQNYARRDGGAINIALNSYNATIEDCIFTNNSCGDDGGVINWEGNLGLVKNITCYNNKGISYNDVVTGQSNSKGGVICLTGDNVTITESKFTLSTILQSPEDNDAGAMFITGENTTVSHSTFDRCYAPEQGGAMKIIGNLTTVINCTFTNCNSSEEGGAIVVEGLDCKVYNSTFRNILAGDDGGAILWIGQRGLIYNSTFSITNAVGMNGHHSKGGAVNVVGDYSVITKSKFEMTSSAIDGGAIYATGNHINITDSTFNKCNVSHASEANYAHGGGAIYVQGVNALIANSTFDQTNARIGGTLYIDGRDAVVDNITINRTFVSTHGGAIYIKGVNAVINNSDISMNNATLSGGAVYIEGRYATIENSAFSNTVAKSGSSFTNSNLGGAIYIMGNDASIIGSKFNNSNAYRGGMIYLEGSYCDVINSSFENGHTSWDGGAVYATGSHSNVLNSNFTNNVADQDGGALFWYGKSSNNVVDGCIFIGNIAYAPGDTIIPDTGKRTTRGGGAIYWSEGGIDAIVRNSQFINNSARTNAKADGGAILWDYSSGTAILDNCTFDGNFITTSADITGKSPWVQGGAIYIRPTGNFIVNNSEFRNCWSIREAGALYVDGANAPNTRIINTKFINNTAKGQGANIADNDRGGGGLMIKGTKNVWVINATFINNTANYGGALSIWKLQRINSPIVYVINTTFDGNKATGGKEGSNSGGSIYATAYDTACNFELENITFINGKADYMGGGMYLTNNAVLTYKNLTFINNSAELGGGLYWDRAVTIQGMNFINNSANQGGAIFVPKGQTIQYNNFTGNNATTEGGAIYVSSSGVTIKYNNFTNNTANMGGAIFTPISDNTISITYSNFTGNNATKGGAIYNGYKGANGKYITYCNFIRNNAIEEGGAVYLANDNQQIIYCNFESNSAGKGGSVYVDMDLSNIYIKNSKFKTSQADNGGAVYYAGSTQPNLWIQDSDFINNTAAYNGGAVYYVTIENGISPVYRDFNNFDGIGVINSSTHRTDVRTNSTSTHIIQRCLFEDNYDYLLNILTETSYEAPVITVIVDSPRNVNRKNIHTVISLTNSTTGQLISQAIITHDNYFEHYNEHEQTLYATFTGLLTNQTYNITVEFENTDYLYKTNSTSETAHGDPIGDFTLLQRWIEGNITNGKYEIHLPRTMRFTPYYGNDTTYTLDTKCMNLTNIKKPFTIYGDGWGIDARGFSRIFNITAANVTFIDVDFSNGNASGPRGDGVDKGGAIYWAGVNGKLIDCNFFTNNATLGGGLYYEYTALNAKIYNTTFRANNAVTKGGAIDCNSPGMELENTTFISNTAYIGAALCREVNATGGHGFNNTFTDNHAEYAGAALAWVNASSIHIDTYYFYNNTAGYSGGAIYVGEGSGNCEIINCLFDNNYVDNATDGHGGAIEWYAEKGLVDNSIFTNNHAYDGGAIYVGSASGKINITKSTFEDNYALNVGGAVSLSASSVTINQSNFYNNKALQGGALYVGGEGETNYVYNSVFEGNNATDGNGGAINWMASSGTIINSNLTNNNAYYGGGIYFGGLSEESIITSCIFKDNHAKYNGGAIDCNASRMFLSHTVFDGNYAQFGAALCRETNAQKGSGENNTFINNHAFVSGAALGWMGSIGIKITNYTFINNSADVSGGAIYVSPTSHNCSIIDSYFEDNFVTNASAEDLFTWPSWDGDTMTYSVRFTDDPSLANKTIMDTTTTTYYYLLGEYPDDLAVGGAINILAENATIQNSNFTRNTARLGGGIYVGADSGHTIINVSVWRENVAYERGGAINLHASGVHIDDGEFYNNIAVNGSAVFVGGVGTENKIHGSIFDGNIAKDYGAGVYWVAYEGEIVNSSFTRNSAVYGGGIYLNGKSSNTNITNTTFTYNNATKNGGAIECNAENIGIYNLTFEHNYAGEYGAALCRESGARYGHGDHNVFNYNHAGIAGAALAWMGVQNIHIDYYNFTGNTAGQRGGAIYVGNDSDFCIVEHCIFTGNNVTNETLGIGGAIDINADNATVIHSIFTDNHASVGGAIAAGEESGFTKINNVTFTRNGATIDGGAINLRATGVSVNDTRFYSNTAGRHGGALMVGGTGKNNTIYYSVFEKNTAGDHGGAIDWLAAAGDIFYSNFTANEAVYGGGIYLNGISSQSRIFNVIFDANRATKNGGAIDCNASMMGLNNTRFTNNYAGEYGAALCREANATGGFGGNNSFIKNHADIAGAALAWLGVDGININNYTFINNTAFKSGGAIYVRGDSPNCKVRNSYFDTNYITDVKNGQGGAIDWVGPNGLIANTTFIDSIAVNGGTIFAGVNSTNITIFNSSFVSSRALGDGGAIALYSDNAKITYSNFTFSLALISGGAISGHNTDNTTIDYCIFDYGMGAGYIDSSLKAFGEGGAIHWENSTDLSISNSNFLNLRSNANGGSISAVNCNDSTLYNLTFNNEVSSLNGGSISWINSTNLTFDSLKVNKSKAFENGGAFYLIGVNDTTIKNSIFYDVKTPDGNGGGIYVDGNVTVQNSTFANYEASIDYGGALYFNGGISTVIDSNFTGVDAIWVYRPATVHLTNNNITGPNPNKNMTYLERDYNSKYNPVDYSVWNDGILYLDKNSFDYVIFNNGTIMTQTYLDMLNNSTYEVEWNTTFTFFANITDDNDNTIISVHTLGTYNDHPEYDAGAKYNLTYNRWVSPAFIQDVFLLSGNDTGLAKCSYRNGTLKVKMQPIMKITKSEEVYENITFTAEIIIPYDGVNSNYTINKNEQVHFVIGGKDYYGNISCVSTDNKHWIIAYANVTLNHMHTGTYTVTATYDGDDYHFGVTNYTTVVLKARPIWIIIEVADIYYNQTLICNVTTNATNTENGYIWLRINGKEVASPVKLENGTKVVYIPESVYGSIINTTGEYTMSVMFSNDTYYDYQINFTTFHVKKFDTNITANVTTPIVHDQNEIINVTVNETATGFVKITIPGYGYIIEEIDHGKAQFNISDLAVGEYINCTIEYYGDDFFNGNSTNVTFVVKPASDYILDVKVDDITYGNNATVRVLVPTHATGNVTIYVDGKKVGTVNITNGTASLSNITGLAGGVHIVNVTYNGDAEHYPKDKNGTEFTVHQTKDWSMTINGDYKPYGENTTITITVPSDVRAKNVTIMIDGVSYVRDVIGNVATLTLNNLSAGRHEANVSYAGNANYTYKLQKFFPDIPQADPTLIITRVNGDVIVTIPENATGNISVFINGKTYENKTVNGVATFKDVLHIGFNYVTASYPGDKNYTKEFNMTTFEIVKTSTDLTVVATPTSIILGNNVLITVTMVNVTAGKVLIEVNNYNYTVDINSRGIATLELALPVGTYTPKAYYLGDVEHAASNKTGNAFEVIDKITPEITITVPSDLKVGDVVNITVTSNGYNLTVWIDGVKQTIVNGNITYTVPSAGIHTIFANTTENATHYSANKTAVFEAVKNNATLIISDINIVYVGDQVIITVTPTTDGAITIKVDDVVINNGDAFTPNLEGKYTITVESAETVKYNAGFNSTVFTVNKRSSQINVTATGNSVGNNATITVQVQTNATGYVTVNVNGTNYTIALNSTGAGSVNITGLGNGTYYVHATYLGDDQYLSRTNDTVTFEMTKVDTAMVIDVDDINYGESANITVTITPGATGYITIRINETKSITLPIVEGKVNWVVEGLGADNYTVYANYSGDGKYLINNTNKVNESFEVRKADPKLEIVSFNCVVYENGKIEISINSETAGEKLNITVGDFEYKDIVIPADGKLAFNISNTLNEFKYYNVTVKYDGNANFTNATFKYAYHTTKVTTYGINVTGMNITVGDDEIITVEVPNHVDDVVIWINGKDSFRNNSFSGNKATFNITDLNLKQGIYTVTATVNDTEFEHKNFTSIFTVNKTSVPMNITVFNNASIYVGDTVKVVVSVPKDVTENVTIEINNIRLTNVTDANGNATFYVPSITYGDKTVVAAYIGDDKYYYNSTTANFTVNKRDSQINVTPTGNSVGNNATISVKVPANATGYVTVNVN
ncbi:MAG: Ig-like domain repeat protein, partial [Methanobrevibacter sp.]|uniref:Ig-like domain repeat protein n=1 Tax=Methanobrevibacter sp. TaxID=66852 RepID=UPI002E7A9826